MKSKSESAPSAQEIAENAAITQLSYLETWLDMKFEAIVRAQLKIIFADTVRSAITAAVTAAEQDTARLDWLEEHDLDWRSLEFSDQGLRFAIDAAAEQKKKDLGLPEPESAVTVETQKTAKPCPFCGRRASESGALTDSMLSLARCDVPTCAGSHWATLDSWNERAAPSVSDRGGSLAVSASSEKVPAPAPPTEDVTVEDSKEANGLLCVTCGEYDYDCLCPLKQSDVNAGNATGTREEVPRYSLEVSNGEIFRTPSDCGDYVLHAAHSYFVSQLQEQIQEERKWREHYFNMMVKRERELISLAEEVGGKAVI